MMPALLISTSIVGRSFTSVSPNARMLFRLARSSERTSTFAAACEPLIRATASLAFSALRHAITTCAPRPARTRQASRPMPLFAPVTTKVLPVRSGTLATE
jgi:hypothetical protein